MRDPNGPMVPKVIPPGKVFCIQTQQTEDFVVILQQISNSPKSISLIEARFHNKKSSDLHRV